MSDNEYIDVPVRGLSWQTICGLACRALLLGVSFNDICVAAINARLKESSHD